MSENERPDIDQIEHEWSETSAGEWRYDITDDGNMIVRMDATHDVGWDIEGSCKTCTANLRFVAASHQDVPALIAYIRALEARAADDRALIAQQQGQLERIGAVLADADNMSPVDALMQIYELRRMFGKG